MDYTKIQEKFYKRLQAINKKIVKEKNERKRHILEGEMHIIDVMFIKGFRPDRPNNRFWEVYEAYVKTYVPEGYKWFKKLKI